MDSLTLDLHPAAGGRYAIDLRVGAGVAWTALAAGSASLYLDPPPPPEPDVQRLTFRQAVAYPFGLDPLRDDRASLHVYIYRPVDREAILDFDRRINARYTEFFVTTGERPAGTFDVEGLGTACLGEIAAMDMTSRAEFEAVTHDLAIPDDVAGILAECRELQDRSFERFVLWLTPLGRGG